MTGVEKHVKIRRDENKREEFDKDEKRSDGREKTGEKQRENQHQRNTSCFRRCKEATGANRTI